MEGRKERGKLVLLPLDDLRTMYQLRRSGRIKTRGEQSEVEGGHVVACSRGLSNFGRLSLWTSYDGIGKSFPRATPHWDLDRMLGLRVLIRLVLEGWIGQSARCLHIDRRLAFASQKRPLCDRHRAGILYSGVGRGGRQKVWEDESRMTPSRTVREQNRGWNRL